VSNAPPHLRLWILLCSDLAIRSGTAAGLGPSHYYAQTGELRFTTKHGAKLMLPVTSEVRELIEQCDLRVDLPFTYQLWQRRPGKQFAPSATSNRLATPLRAAFRKLCLAQGITRRIVPHDLRRTTAVAMLRHTHDVRDVQAILGHRSLQSTIWYLDHDLQPVQRVNLAALKRPYLVPPKERTA
jgi:site-specific recombinase XerC